MKRRGFLASVVFLLTLALAVTAMLAGCGEKKEEEKKEEEKQEVTVETIQEGKLLMGSDTTYPPFENKDESGKVEGFDIDLATEIAERLGLELEVISVKWEGIIPGLKMGDYDIVMSAMTITEERKQEIDFTDPYIDSNQSIAVKEDNEEIKSEEDLVGKVVGVQVDTTGQFTAEEIEGIKEVVKYDTILLAFQDLELGRVDAVMNDYPVNAYLCKTRGGSKVVKVIKTDESYGIGVQKGNDQLREAINKVLAEMKEDGSYDEIYEKWFGEEMTTG